MTTEELLTAVLGELKGIRDALAQRPAPAYERPANSPQSTLTGTQAEIPQPATVVENPGDVQVHFGKNKGVALSALTANSLKFYASVKDVRLDSNGKPYPPRADNIALENAARTLHHRNLGTLAAEAGKPMKLESPPAQKAGAAVDEDVPFARREYDSM